MTSEQSKTDSPNQQTNFQSDTPYYKTQEYQDAMKNFVNDSQSQHFKKDKTKAVHKSKNARGTRSYRALQFSPENVQLWLQNPMMNEALLRDFSNFLYDTNALYKWTITTRKSPDKTERLYRQGIKYLHNKNIKYEMNKAFLLALKNDFFYGYEIEEDDYYYVLNLDPNFCRISRQVGDGIYGFQFDFAFFDSKLNVEEDYPVINSYPIEFRRKYEMYQRGDYRSSWIDLDVDKTICLKMNDELLYGLPYYANLFPLLVDLGFYKDLARERAEIDNFLLLHQEIPLRQEGFNDFSIDLDTARDFNYLANEAVPDGAKVITSPMKLTSVKTERGSTDKNNVKDALSQVYTGSGIPQAISNADTNTAAGISRAIVVNEQIVFRFFR